MTRSEKMPDGCNSGHIYLADMDKHNQVNRSVKRIKPPVRGVKLFEFIHTAILEKILLAASLKVKGVHGHPSWVLESPNDLKARPITI